MRKLKIPTAKIEQILDQLDEEEQADVPAGISADMSFPYRVPSLTVKVEHSGNQMVSYLVPTRNISRKGISFLVGNVVNVGSICMLHLITLRNNWQTVRGHITKCRYISGTACIHEARVDFDYPIDPASFAPTAVRARVLVVDDSLMIQKLLTQLLTDLNVEVVCVNNGLDAVKLAEGHPFDLILMDLEMPELPGMDAIRMLRGKGYTRSIIATSSLESDQVREDCILAGSDDFLAKPIHKNNLAMVITRTKPEPLVSSLLHQPSMHPLIDEFVSSLPATIRQLESAYAAQNVEWLGLEARRLKGEAASFGFEPITALASDLDAVLKKDFSWVHIRGRLSELIRMCLAARPATQQAADLWANEEPHNGRQANTSESEATPESDAADLSVA